MRILRKLSTEAGYPILQALDVKARCQRVGKHHMEDICQHYVRCTRVKRSTRGVGLLQPPGSQMGSEEMVYSRLLQTPEEPRRLIPGADGRKLPLLSIVEAGAGGLSRMTHRHE